ncbi:MAG TPA: hypothetical protein PLQ63_06595 [Propionicimonas sp.]|nr:hypothetical protein [Propionicimonas sp.]HRA75504.1 hypothetical protein [Propionicimonas sp.]
MTYPTGWDGPGYYAAQLAPETVGVDTAPPAARTGIVPPRPLQIGDILSGAFHAVRFAPATMFGLTLVTMLVAQLLGTGLGLVIERQFGFTLLPSEDGDALDAGLFGWSTILGQVFTQLTAIVVGMGLTYTVFQAVSGRSVPPAEALRHMVGRLGAALGFSALTALAVSAGGGLVFAMFVPVLGGDTGGLVVVAILAGLVTLVLAIWLGTKLLLAPSAIAVEGLGPIQAIPRSWTLTRGQFWRVLGIYLLASMIIGFAASTVSSVFSFGAMLLSISDPGVLLLAVTIASTLTSSVLTVPLTTAVSTLLYVDARIRREGYDLHLAEVLYG